MKDGERSGKKDREKNRRKVSNDTASITTEPPPPPSGSSSSLSNFISPSPLSQVLSHSFLPNLSPLTLLFSFFSSSFLLPNNFFFLSMPCVSSDALSRDDRYCHSCQECSERSSSSSSFFSFVISFFLFSLSHRFFSQFFPKSFPSFLFFLFLPHSSIRPPPPSLSDL